MATYSTLVTRALNQLRLASNLDAQEVAEVAIAEAMKFVAFHVRIPSLLPSVGALAPAPGIDDVISMTLTGTFGLSAGVYQAPDRLWVAQAQSDVTDLNKGTAYTFVPYDTYLDLTSISSNYREDLSATRYDELPSSYVWTIKDDSTIFAKPLAEDNYVTLRYHKVPTAYASNGTPEILPMFDFILVNATVLALKEWLREPDQMLTLWDLYQSLMPSIDEYKRHITATRKRGNLRIHRAYRAPRSLW